MKKHFRLRLVRFIITILLLSPILSFANEKDIIQIIKGYESFFQRSKRIDTDTLLTGAIKRVEVAVESGDKALEAEARRSLGVVQLSTLKDYKSGIENLIRALGIEDTLQNIEGRIVTYVLMAKAFEDVAHYYKSAELLSSAIDASRTMDDPNVLAYLLNKLGTVNMARGLSEEALENFSLILENKDKLDSRREEGDALYNLARLHIIKNDLKKALEYHKKALEVRRQMRDKAAEAVSLNDIGEVYKSLKNYDKALANHLIALKIRSTLKDQRALAQSYNNIGVLYHNQRNYQRAVPNLELALKSANESQAMEESVRSYDYLSLCFKETGDFKRALEFIEASVGIKELMQSEKTENESIERQNRYDLEKKEFEIRKLQDIQRERDIKIENQKRTQNFLFALIGLVIVILLLTFYLYLVKRRSNISLEAAHARVNLQNQQLQSLNATKDKFFSIISHDLKGPLNSFTSFSSMLINYVDNLSKEEIKMLALEIDKNLKNLYALLENLLEWSRSQTGSIEFKPEAVDLHELLLQNKELLTTQAKNKAISLVYTNEEKLLVRVHKQSVNTVIRNLISNAIKFTPEGGTIMLRVKTNTRDVTVGIQDNGVGMSEDVIKKLFRIDTKYSTNGTANEKGTGLGLILCKEFIEKNGGTIGVKSEPGKGSLFFFTFPLMEKETHPSVASAQETSTV